MSARAIDPKLYQQVAGSDVPAAIATRAEHQHALSIVEALMLKENRTAEESRLLETWATLVESYEKRAFPRPAKSEPRKVLRFLLEENGLTQRAFEPDIPQSRVSDILNGRREISKEQAKFLAQRFRVSTDLFL